MLVVRRMAIGLLTLCMWLGTQAQAQVLNQLPAEPMLAVKIKSLAELNQKAAFFAQDWGFVEMKEELKDPLGYVLGLGGMGAGLDKTGEAAIAAMMPQGGGEPEVMALIPVTDFAAFAKTLPNAKPDGEFTTFAPGPQGVTLFAIARGKWAAISDKKELLAKPVQALLPPAVVAKEFATKDVVAYVNMKVIRPKVLPEFQKNKANILNMMEQGMQQAQGFDPKFAPVFKAYMAQIMGMVEGFLKDTEAVTLGISLSKQGIGTTMFVLFDANSYMGKALSKMKNTDASFTAGLPQHSGYLMYGGGVMDAQGIQVMKDFLAPIEKELNAMGAQGKPLAAYFENAIKMMASMRSMNFGIMTPGFGAMVQSGLIQSVSVMNGDSAQMQAAQNAAMKGQDELMKMVGADAAGLKMTLTPAAKTVQGVALDQLSMKLDGKAQTPEQQRATFLMRMMFGAKGAVTYTGVVNKDKMISVLGDDDSLLENAIAAVKNNADPLGKGAAAPVIAALPQNRLAAIYVPIDQIARTVFDFLAMRGLPAGVKIPENLPPLGATFAAEGSSLRIDGFMPEETIKALVGAGMQLYLKQMPGNQPGNPARP